MAKGKTKHCVFCDGYNMNDLMEFVCKTHQYRTAAKFFFSDESSLILNEDEFKNYNDTVNESTFKVKFYDSEMIYFKNQIVKIKVYDWERYNKSEEKDFLEKIKKEKEGK